MQQLCDEHGSRLLVAMLQAPPNEEYTAFFERESIEFVDCVDPTWPSPALRVGGVGHPNEVLHAR